MLLTETDAKRKWCPFAASNTDNTSCIADSCAVWRWTPITNPSNGAQRSRVADNPAAKTEQEAGPRPEDCRGREFCPSAEDDPAVWVEPEMEAYKRRLGYCGLAGKPEL